MAADAGGPRALGHDQYALGGKFEAPYERFEVVVVGAGPAGIAAAARAAAEGASVLIVDENPLSPGLIGMDVPLFFGGRAGGAVQTPARLEERFIAASPGLEELYAAGVEVRLRTVAWGAFVKGPALNALHEPVLGLADEERSWLCGFQRLIIAAGARDLVLSFKGWDQPGVMGALAFAALVQRYDAFEGRRVAILGTGALALQTAHLALEKGLEVSALVEVRSEPQGDPSALSNLMAKGVPLFLSHAPLSALGGPNGVTSLRLVPSGDATGPAIDIACDTVCLAIGQLPAVELFGAMGAPLVFDAARGGHVPSLSPAGETGAPGVFAAGACAGIARGSEGCDYDLDWAKALLAVGGLSVEVCQCEAVSREALLNVRQPAYLGPPSEGMTRRGLATLRADGPFNLDQIKRLTRAGMGPCQGRRCREQVALTLAAASGVPVSALALTGYRAPVRPLPLGVLADWEEGAEMGRGWDVWFGIPAQWVPYRDIGAEREAMHLARLSGEDDVG